MEIDLQQGLLNKTVLHLSPNHDDRPDPTDISGIVIHNISLPPGEFGGGWVDDLFLNKLDPNAHPYFAEISHLRVSTHILIRRDGELIQYVPFAKRAWHAGLSSWEGRERCNDFTIGIELEGCDDNKFEQAQYQQLSELIVALCASYPLLTTDKIKGHSDISPDRKTDPGPFFNWEELKKMLV
jgi:N-acetyl-anhydromuramoyl-L-alanine amidase